MLPLKNKALANARRLSPASDAQFDGPSANVDGFRKILLNSQYIAQSSVARGRQRIVFPGEPHLGQGVIHFVQSKEYPGVSKAGG